MLGRDCIKKPRRRKNYIGHVTNDLPIELHDEMLQTETQTHWVECENVTCQKWRREPGFTAKKYTCDLTLGSGGCNIDEDQQWLDILCFSGVVPELSESDYLERRYVENALRSLLHKIDGYVRHGYWDESMYPKVISGLKMSDQSDCITGTKALVDHIRQTFAHILTFVPVDSTELLDLQKRTDKVFTIPCSLILTKNTCVLSHLSHTN